MKKERKEGNWTQQHARLSDLLAVTEALTGGRDSNAKDGTNFQFNSWCKSTKMEGGTGREDNPLPWRWTSVAPAVPDCQSGRACVPACLDPIAGAVPGGFHFHWASSPLPFPILSGQVGSRDWRIPSRSTRPINVQCQLQFVYMSP